jgi:hypothetical protein
VSVGPQRIGPRAVGGGSIRGSRFSIRLVCERSVGGRIGTPIAGRIGVRIALRNGRRVEVRVGSNDSGIQLGLWRGTIRAEAATAATAGDRQATRHQDDAGTARAPHG